MKPTELLEDIKKYCEAHTNEAIVKKYARYFKGGYDAYGLTTELIHLKAKSLLENPELTLPLVLETAPLLVRSAKYEEPVFAILLLKNFHKQFTTSTFHEIGKWFDLGISNWAHSDILCGDLLWTLFEKKLVSPEDFIPWRTAANKFKRRAVPVSMIKPMKKSREAVSYFPLIEPMMEDPEREVHQGLGWFLREAWRISPAETEVFLHRWKNQAPRLIFQYATEKMTPEGREKFRKEKK